MFDIYEYRENKKKTIDMVQYWPTQDEMAIHGFDNATYGLEPVHLYGQTTEYQPQKQYTPSEIDHPS